MFDDQTVLDPVAVEGLSDAQLEGELCSRAAHIAAAECRLVLLVAELDRRGTWAAQGLRSCAHWLNWRCGVSLGAAREQVRVGRALPGRPVLAAAFASGELSYSKVRAITRVATAATEASLVEMARYATASQLERIVREYRRADPDEGTAALRRHSGRFVRTYTDDEGMVVIRARLSPEDGAFVLEAIEAARRALDEDRRGAEEEAPDVSAETRPEAPDVSAETRPGAIVPWEGPGAGHEADRADALVAVCESVLAGGIDPGHGGHRGVSVLVHVDDRVLGDPGAEGCAHIEGAGAISAHTAQRLACDAAVARLRYGAGGAGGAVGAGVPGGTVAPEGRTREIPPTMRRAVLARDRGCRWPGCTQRRFVDVHHVRFVSHGGRTVLSNLVSACRFHHRMVHEGGYRLVMDARGAVRVSSPGGTEIPQVPPAAPAHGPGLAAQHRRDGLDIGAGTLAYCGERFDLGLTIDCLLAEARRGERPAAAAARAPTCSAAGSASGTASAS